MNDLWFDISLADTTKKWIIRQFVRKKTFIFGIKHQFLTFFHGFLELFYNFIVTNDSTVNELWFDIILADTLNKWIVWQFARKKTFILGIKHQFMTFFHRFLEIFYNFLITNDSTINELWFDIILAYTFNNWIIWQFTRKRTFIFGDKTSIFDIFSQISRNIL